jgi:hypothetical protein
VSTVAGLDRLCSCSLVAGIRYARLVVDPGWRELTFGKTDSAAALSILGDVRVAFAALVIAALGLAN